MAAWSPRRAEPDRGATPAPRARRGATPARTPSRERARARYFIALRPEPPVREELARLAAALARQVQGRPVAAADVHLTLQFIGEAPRALEPALAEIVRALPPPPPDVPLDRLGRFGARLVWIGPRRCPDALQELSRTVRERLDALGVAYDRKRFVAHLSLVRGARSPGAEPPAAPDPGSLPATLGPCRAFLVESELLASGSRYRWIGEDVIGSSR